MLTVHQGVPIPKVSRGRQVNRRETIYPFAELMVGDMFFVPRDRNNLVAYASARGRLLKRKFKTRLLWAHKVKGVWTPCAETTSGAVQGVMIWRVA